MPTHNHGEVKHFAQGHTPSKWGSQNYLALKASILDHQVTLLLRQRGSKKIPVAHFQLCVWS